MIRCHCQSVLAISNKSLRGSDVFFSVMEQTSVEHPRVQIFISHLSRWPTQDCEDKALIVIPSLVICPWNEQKHYDFSTFDQPSITRSFIYPVTKAVTNEFPLKILLQWKSSSGFAKHMLPVNFTEYGNWILTARITMGFYVVTCDIVTLVASLIEEDQRAKCTVLKPCK